MNSWNKRLILNHLPATDFPSYHAYEQGQTEIFIESMKETAYIQWDLFGSQMQGASEDEILDQMKRWWKRQIRLFRATLRREYDRDQRRALGDEFRALNELLRHERHHRREAQSKLTAAQECLDQAEIGLQIEREHTAYLKEEKLCRRCNEKIWT